MKLTKVALLVACTLMLSGSGFADSVLVGTDLTGVTGGAGLCPSGDDCHLIAQEFTLVDPVVIDQIKIVIAGPNLMGNANGSFSVSLGALGGGEPIGSGDLMFDPNGKVVAQVFDFGDLDISLAPGTYYLQVSGGNLQWPAGVPFLTSTGTVGPLQECDPTVQFCSIPASWQAIDNPRGFEIDGTVVPEPSSLLLFGTGLLGVCEVVRRRVRLLTD